MDKLEVLNAFVDVFHLQGADCITEVSLFRNKYWMHCDYYNITIEIMDDYITIIFQDEKEWHIDFTMNGVVDASVLIGKLIEEVA